MQSDSARKREGDQNRFFRVRHNVLACHECRSKRTGGNCKRDARGKGALEQSEWDWLVVGEANINSGKEKRADCCRFSSQARILGGAFVAEEFATRHTLAIGAFLHTTKRASGVSEGRAA